MAYVNNSRAAELGLRARLSGLLDGLAARYAQYRLYRTTYDELNRLSDRELADLGLHRANIASVSLEAAYRT
jgi:uncharacterized protein YjiS (DUF1127 family)